MMANSNSQIYIHYIFTVKGRNNFLSAVPKVQLQRFINSVIEKRKSIMVAINNVDDHMHILVRLNATYSVSRMIQEIKATSSKFINEKKWIRGKFRWQGGYGAFSVSKSQLSKVIKYIDDQEVHHQILTFRDEFLGFLQKNCIEYDEKYLFEFYE